MKKCIFCKKDSSESKSIEHIIPESLGNIKHILPRGIVCDKCNNYFSRKIEKPLLNTLYFKYARSLNYIKTKKGKYNSHEGYNPQSNTKLEILFSDEGWSIFPSKQKDEEKFVDYLMSNNSGTIIVPYPIKPSKKDKYIVSRFLGKAAIEALAQRLYKIKDGLIEVTNKKELDELRYYVRFGSQTKIWTYYERRIYQDGKIFISKEEEYEVFHEYDFLYTKNKELYFVITFFGIA